MRRWNAPTPAFTVMGRFRGFADNEVKMRGDSGFATARMLEVTDPNIAMKVTSLTYFTAVPRFPSATINSKIAENCVDHWFRHNFTLTLWALRVNESSEAIHHPNVLPAPEFLSIMIDWEQDGYYSHIQHANKLFGVDCIILQGSNALNCKEKLVQ